MNEPQPDNETGSHFPPASMTAAIMVDELIRNGVRDVVICPGSRSAPLAFAFAEAARRGRITIHMRTDERTAAFLAIGLSRGSAPHGRGIVPIVMTSGSALAHCTPAMVEAQIAGIPIMVISANRPWSYWGTGANQTIQQQEFFASAGVHYEGIDAAIGDRGAWTNLHRQIRATIDRAVAHATGSSPAPVHLDVPFQEPLVVGNEEELHHIHDFAASLGRAHNLPWRKFTSSFTIESRRILHIAGDGSRAAEHLPGIPTIAEPTAAAGDLPIHPLALPHLTPEHVIVSGRPTLHRSVSKLLADPTIPITYVVPHATGGIPLIADVAHTVSTVATSLHYEPQDPLWQEECKQADENAISAVRNTLSESTSGEGKNASMTGLAVAAAIADHISVGDALVVGASNPIRDLSFAGAPFDGVDIYSSRGTAGIDGFLSTAVGIALSRQRSQPDEVRAPRTVAFAGDLTFLHDATGLNIGPDEPQPSNLLIVLANDSGGSIFESLEPGKNELRSYFERIVATRHSTDFEKLTRAFHVNYARATTLSELSDLLEAHAEGAILGSEADLSDEVDELHGSDGSGGSGESARAANSGDTETYSGITLIEAQCDRTTRRDVHSHLVDEVARLVCGK